MKHRTIRRAEQGFTLIEVMIVTAVIAILAAIAFPSYTASVIKGKRAEGRAALVELMQQQERFMTQRNTYASWTDPALTTGDAALFKKFSGDLLARTAYRLVATDCDGDGSGGFATNATKLRECVLLTAIPTFTDAQMGNLELRSTGQKSCTTNSPACWN